METIFRQIGADFERHVARLQRLVQQPSISATGEGVPECARLVTSMIEELGGKARAVPTAGHPVVFGQLDAGQPHTLLVYGMYDVQPAGEPGWSVPPFAGAIKEVPSLGACLVARGATNSKGPLAGFFNAVEAVQRSGAKLPVNLLFVVEGEEELGSPSLRGFVEEHRDILQRADAVFFGAFREDRRGWLTSSSGQRGLSSSNCGSAGVSGAARPGAPSTGRTARGWQVLRGGPSTSSPSWSGRTSGCACRVSTRGCSGPTRTTRRR